MPAAEDGAAGLLAGVRVLDFTQILAGPFCTALLADLGAEVIKVEPPRGDEYRRIGPFRNGESGLFQMMNRGKRGIVLDLKQPEGRALARRLAAASDVVVENFRPGVARRLEIDYATLGADNPRLVYASISGFGQESPLAHLPAYDIVAQAMSGLMTMTGAPDGPPTMIGESLADLTAGLFTSWAVVAALFHRERAGVGQYVDTALFDSMFALMPTAMAQLTFGGRQPSRVGNRHQLSAPFGVFAAGDGHLVIAVLNGRQFESLARAIGAPELIADDRFASDESRARNEASLRHVIEQWTGARPAAEAIDALSRAGVPVAPIWTVAEAAGSPQVSARDLLAKAVHPQLGEIRLLQQPVAFNGRPRGQARPAPALGADTEAVLGEVLGLDEAALAAARRAGAF